MATKVGRSSTSRWREATIYVLDAETRAWSRERPEEIYDEREMQFCAIDDIAAIPNVYVPQILCKLQTSEVIILKVLTTGC